MLGAAEHEQADFSRRAAGDSKTLERQLRVVATLVQRAYPEITGEEELADVDLLASLGVEKLPQPLLAGGPVSIDGDRLPRLPFVGVSPDQHHRLSIGSVDYVLTIENYTSFVRHCRELNRNGDGLVIFTGGFPARTILQAIATIAERSKAPTFHWGDLDPGGLRIFVHIEAALRRLGVHLRPHLMDDEVLSRHGRVEDRPSRPLLPGRAANSAISDLWDSMARATPYRELEQEELDPLVPAHLGETPPRVRTH